MRCLDWVYFNASASIEDWKIALWITTPMFAHGSLKEVSQFNMLCFIEGDHLDSALVSALPMPFFPKVDHHLDSSIVSALSIFIFPIY